MLISMKQEQRSLEQIRAFVEGSEEIQFEAAIRKRYIGGWKRPCGRRATGFRQKRNGTGEAIHREDERSQPRARDAVNRTLL